MRKMSAALVAMVAAIALVALSAPAWAAKSTSKSLVVSPTETKAGQMVQVSFCPTPDCPGPDLGAQV